MTDPRHLRAQTKSALRGASNAFGRRTSFLRRLPDFLIIGAQRCGTTSLFRYLAQHPTVAPPLFNKGLHYFDTNFTSGLSWYRGQFPLKRPAILPPRVTGEASPYYLFHPCAARRIASALPDVKLIVMLRDPRERAFSAYKQEVGRGFENLSFEAALHAEVGRLQGEVEKLEADPSYNSFHHQHHAYVGRGRYAEQLSAYFTHVPRERVLILESEQFFAEPVPAWDQVLDFLALESWRPSAFDKHNARPSEAMSQEAAAYLDARFEAPDEALERLLAHPVAWTRRE